MILILDNLFCKNFKKKKNHLVFDSMFIQIKIIFFEK